MGPEQWGHINPPPSQASPPASQPRAQLPQLGEQHHVQHFAQVANAAGAAAAAFEANDPLHHRARPPAQCRRGKRGDPEKQALGRSRGGLSTKIHTTVDALGNPTGFVLTPGQGGFKSKRKRPIFYETSVALNAAQRSLFGRRRCKRLGSRVF